jgi:centromeric protein E
MATPNQSSMGVAIRIRPLNGKENKRGDTLCWLPNPTATSLIVPEAAKSAIKTLKHGQQIKLPKFQPGSVHGPDCTTKDVYESVSKHVVEGSLRGINGTILAYGQTSSGKTHTMLGDQNNPGVILMAVQDIFQHISENEEREWFLRVSMVEIYNEVVADLLEKGNDHLGVFNGKDGRDVVIKGVHEEIVTSANQVWNLLEMGFGNRSVSGTDMNAVSSRSHTVFRMVIESRAIGANKDSKVRVSALNMVDLAGSEKMAHAGTGGFGKKKRRNEGININKSLLTLGTVIKQLMKQAARGTKQHIQYRNSMLTRVLAKSIGGSAQTAVICTLAPSHMYYADSKITLGFASNACQVKVKARVNDIKAKNAMLGAHAEEMAKLKSELKRWPMGKPENYSEEQEELQQEALKERMAKQEEEVNARTMQVQDEYSKKLAHLQSLILRATGTTADEESGSGGSGGSGSSGLSLNHVLGRGSRGGGGGGGGSGHRDTWGPGEIRKRVVDRHRRTSLGLVVEGDDDEEDEDAKRGSSASVTSVRGDMTMGEAVEEIIALKERLSNEEEDRFDCENELSDLAQDYALLTEGVGIEKKDEDELSHMESIYEQGLVRVMKERYRQKMMATENKLRAEVEALRRQLNEERNQKEMVIDEKTLALTLDNDRLRKENVGFGINIDALEEETTELKKQTVLIQEECDRKVEATKQQVFEHEKLMRASRALKGMTPVKVAGKGGRGGRGGEMEEEEENVGRKSNAALEEQRGKSMGGGSGTQYAPTPNGKSRKKPAKTPMRDLFGC